MRNFNVKIPDDLHKRFKIACAHEEKEMSTVIRERIQNFVEKAEKKPG